MRTCDIARARCRDEEMFNVAAERNKELEKNVHQ